MSTIEELGSFLAREAAAGTTPTPPPAPSTVPAAEASAADPGFNGAPAARRD
jgi:hypothetical protein